MKLTEEAIYAVVTDVRSRIIDQVRVPLGSRDVSDVVTAVRDIVMDFQSGMDQPLDAVGVTVGGRVDEGEIVADSSFLQWRDVPFRSLLGAAVRVPVYLDNDVVGLTKAQQWFGHGKGYSSFALLTVGAGVGYGLVINDLMIPTFLNPLSHYPVDPSGPLCPLGHRGCMTAFLSSSSITAAVSAAHGRFIEYDDVLEMARSGDAPAVRVVQEAARALGRAASAITAFTGVKRIILSGEGVHLADAARSSVDEGLSEYDTDSPLHSELIVRPMDFPEWARGAAVIAIQKTFPRSSPGGTAGSEVGAPAEHSTAVIDSE
ncbi:ROK family protein [Cryobacterium sp. Hh11]|uniref:ROK family protein n=1 Tax=Cryobacterium sp. Hh11 TaxID=2555868 RepID=UPI00141AEBAD|nr:ROK family protein [Cryobacterium sp. Hh11]